jgi:signal transduction histidine kinase
MLGSIMLHVPEVVPSRPPFSEAVCLQDAIERTDGIALDQTRCENSQSGYPSGATLTEYTVDKFESSIATMTPTVRQRRLTLVLAAVVLIATIIIAPFGAIQLRRIDGFIPATESAVVITDLFTAVLLFSQSSIIGSPGLLLLASGYLFSALIVLPHLLTFPGAFAPSGLLGAGLSTTAWLFIFWHLGLPVSVIGYAYLINERRALTRSAICWSVTLVIGLACVLTWFVAVHEDTLPALFVDQIGFTVWANRITSIDFGISVVALVVLWLRQKSVLDLWLIVSVCALVAELAVTTFVITSRFSLGFYTQRMFSLAASTIVLSALLAEAAVLYGRLANTIVLLQRERASKLLNIQAAVGALTHQMRQPLTGIGTRASAARRFLAQSPPDIDRVQRIQDDIVRTTLLTNEAIESIRALFKDADQPQSLVNMNEVVSECLLTMKQELDERMVAVRADLDGSLPLIAGHRGQLREAVLNLMQNAIEAMEASAKGGRNLMLETKRQDQGEVIISVQDTGPGLEQQSTTKIFDAFVTTKDKGTGLGLAVSRMIVELHGGRIIAQSDPGSGARFQIVLPIKMRPETAI